MELIMPSKSGKLRHYTNMQRPIKQSNQCHCIYYVRNSERKLGIVLCILSVQPL
jgi:hypothetical protein